MFNFIMANSSLRKPNKKQWMFLCKTVLNHGFLTQQLKEIIKTVLWTGEQSVQEL